MLSGAASTSPAASNSAGTSTASTRQTPRLLDAAILVAPFGKVELSSYQRPRPDPKGNQAIQLEPHNLSGLAGIVYVHVHAAFGSWREPTATREQRASPPNSQGRSAATQPEGGRATNPRGASVCWKESGLAAEHQGSPGGLYISSQPQKHRSPPAPARRNTTPEHSPLEASPTNLRPKSRPAQSPTKK